jgi:8-oxo-dGTP diphosphatase
MPNTEPENSLLQVAVGVIRRTDGKVLIARRPDHVHQGGLWEFPGGKIEAGESVEQALKRELYEELGIAVKIIEPLIKIPYHYSDRSVLLNVWTVKSFSGQAVGREGQQVAWRAVDQLRHDSFPAANQAIITALLLPRFYAVLEGETEAEVINNLEQILAKDISLIQFRLKTLKKTAEKAFLQGLVWQAKQKNCQVLLNTHLLEFHDANTGIHLTRRDLLSGFKRPEGLPVLAASCHDEPELALAEKAGVDFAVIAPVQKTVTHPDAPALGWERFRQLAAKAVFPVYALGGVNNTDLDQAIYSGAQGIAGIRTFLGSQNR